MDLESCWNCNAASREDEAAPIEGRDDGMDPGENVGRNGLWHDPVTGLPRPARFLEHLEHLLGMPCRPPQSVAMLLLEVADLHGLSALYGEPWCDELLRTIAERLHDQVPEPNLFTRLRGGAFAIVLHDLGSEVTPRALATHLLERASAPCPNVDRPPRWTVVGALAVADDRAETAIGLLDRATRALARARFRAAAQPWMT
jgi:GGDEF domain-containing protein